ncbi:hypothetical protein HOLleu_08396 [Holothuria leucospilota]|uniref:RING-type domain-containing protein n=1 Tax=Holothuria leucospilota TaxID=206669 RepID=A0A9Q1HHR6_HOLLE|nr:hypothetical protein HOLleu_08396 [Holothuria leucospilota]
MSESAKGTHNNSWLEIPFSSPYVAKIIHMDDAREIDCKICTRPYPVKPESLMCGHTFCRACIEVFLIDDETLPRGRNSSDIICPTCTKGSTVHWVIDGDGSNCKEDNFGIGAVRYDAHRKRTIQKYRNLYQTQLRYWKEMVKQEAEEISHRDEYDGESTNCSVKTEQLETDDEDVRGIDHVSGRFINCIIECPSAMTSSSTVGNLQTEICVESEDPGRLCDNFKNCNKDVIRSETSSMDLNVKSKNKNSLNPESSYQNEKNNKTKQGEYDSDCCDNRTTAGTLMPVVSDKRPYDAASLNRTVEIPIPRGRCSSQERKMIPKEKLMWCLGNGDSKNAIVDVESFEDHDERCSLGEWSAHLALIGFIIVLSLVVFVASILGT